MVPWKTSNQMAPNLRQKENHLGKILSCLSLFWVLRPSDSSSLNMRLSKIFPEMPKLFLFMVKLENATIIHHISPTPISCLNSLLNQFYHFMAYFLASIQTGEGSHHLLLLQRLKGSQHSKVATWIQASGLTDRVRPSFSVLGHPSLGKVYKFSKLSLSHL